MLGLTLASLRARPLRALLTAFSIVLGVAMISGTFVVTGQINRAFSQIFDAVNVKNDVVVYLRTVSDDNGGFQEPFPASVLKRVRKVPGVGGRDRGDRRARLAGRVQERQAQARQHDRRRASARVLHAARALRSRHVPARPPGNRASGEIALIEDTADKANVDVGSTVGLVTLDGLKRLRVSGIYTIGTTASLGGALVSSIPLADAQHWYAPGRQVHADQPADGAPASPRRRCATASAPSSARATRCRPAPRRRRPTRRASRT